MRFLADECTSPAVAQWLARQGYDAFSVFDELPGISDEEVIRRAYDERWILITNDKDFGEKVYRQGHPHHGAVLLRLDNERSANKISVLRNLLSKYADRLHDRFIVSSPKSRCASLDRAINRDNTESALRCCGRRARSFSVDPKRVALLPLSPYLRRGAYLSFVVILRRK